MMASLLGNFKWEQHAMHFFEIAAELEAAKMIVYNYGFY